MSHPKHTKPGVRFRGRDLVLSTETAMKMGLKLPPNRPPGEVVVRCVGGLIFWEHVKNLP